MNATKLVKLLAPVALVAAALTAARAEARANRSAPGVGPDTGGWAQGDRRAVIFVQRGCAECHAIAALGVKAAADVGPDLTFAYADVVNRYGVSLESFLYNPTGVMRLMLASHLRLSRVDRDSMLLILRALCDEHRADMDDAMPSLPPGVVRPRARPERPGRAPPQD